MLMRSLGNDDVDSLGSSHKPDSEYVLRGICLLYDYVKQEPQLKCWEESAWSAPLEFSQGWLGIPALTLLHGTVQCLCSLMPFLQLADSIGTSQALVMQDLKINTSKTTIPRLSKPQHSHTYI